MNMFDYFIKEKTEKTWINNAVLDGVLIQNDNGEYHSNYSIDIIGAIPDITGYHVNIRSQEPIEFKNLTTIPAPNTPMRVWL
jgi:hypothetical protein